jgi:pre-mRNA-splicing helicase BRR2
MGVQYFEGREHRYADYPVADVLQMMGHACRPTVDERSRCILMCQQTRKDFYRKFLNEGLPIESHLPTHLLHDFFLAEIAEETIENKQDAIVSMVDLPLVPFNNFLGYSHLDFLLSTLDAES